VLIGFAHSGLDGVDVGWSLFEAVPEAILVVADGGEIAFANARATSLLGGDGDALCGRDVEDLFPGGLASVHHAVRCDGSSVPVEVNVSSLCLGDSRFDVVTIHDIARSVNSEMRLARLLEMVDASADAVFVVDPVTLLYSYVNEAAASLTGYSKSELAAMTPMQLIRHSTAASYRDLLHSLTAREDRPLTSLAMLLCKDGSELPIETTFRASAIGDGPEHAIIGLSRDITRRLADETALREAEQVMAIAADRERIARDLNDTVVRRLFAEALRLQATFPLVDATVQRRLEATVTGLDETIGRLRAAIFPLQGSASGHARLRERVLAAVTDATASLGFEPRLEFDGTIDSIHEDICDQLISVLREALSNIADHANARAVRIALSVGLDVSLTVSDDGIGAPELATGRGLLDMAARAHEHAGNFAITRQSSGGSSLTWRVPIGFGDRDSKSLSLASSP
jgi:PAS domain S-box-containing protein